MANFYEFLLVGVWPALALAPNGNAYSPMTSIRRKQPVIPQIGAQIIFASATWPR